MRVDQVLPGFNRGDAMSNAARFLRRQLAARGFATAIYAEHIQPRARDEAIDVEHFFAAPPPDLTIYHYGIGTPVTARLRRRPEPKLMIYHNVTPAHYFVGVNEELARLCRLGRTDLVADRRRYDAVFAVSEYNRRELLRLGYEQVDLWPLPIDWSDYDREPDAAVLRTLERLGGPHLLFVGRISVNKRQDDVIRAYAAFRRLFAPTAHLWLVGTAVGQESYLEALRRLAQALGVADGTHFIGHASFPELLGYYHGAHLFLSMSEHEGLGIPLLEAMYFGVPVVAHAAAAVPETVADAGLLFTEKRFDAVAALLDRVLSDRALRDQLVAAGRRRVLDFAPERCMARFDALLAERFPRLFDGATAAPAR
ncbi:MAG: glycosyltransferase family 4 protein [Actinomycetia bacterium]|nr:glycosyltransferase family 4 protein [Actinomycetes bacterium]